MADDAPLAHPSSISPVRASTSAIRSRLLDSRWALVALTVLLALVNIVGRYPGEPNNDSDLQYAQILSGHYDDFYPPVMARFWSLLHPLAAGTGPIFVAHVGLYWIGFGLLGLDLLRRERRWAAWLTVLAGATPLLMMMNININNDVGVAASLLTVVGLWLRAQRLGRWDWVSAGAATVLLVYGTLLRTNAVFAAAPVILLVLGRKADLARPVRTLALTIALAAVLIPVSGLVNRHVLAAKPGGALSTLQLFDLVGVARLSGDLKVLPFAGEMAKGAHCYSPVMWDTIDSRCSALDDTVRHRPDLTQVWLRAIAAHPFAYAEHRLLSVNSAFYFYVPPFHVQLARANLDTQTDYRSGKNPLVDFARYVTLLSPASALVVIVGLLLLLRRRPAELPLGLGMAVTVMLLSALLYSAGYLIVGVASEQRYFLWPTMVMEIAVVILGGYLADRWRARDPLFFGALAVLVLVNAVEIFARVTHATTLTAF